ncbi:MAG: prolipoprotein diacylglyceryl transferase [Planctomycetes bacterium]|nr:prolipoprotein diacylglyceryl transferase [Planctomycetota bacterium]
MFPILFKIPYVGLTIWTYGPMLVIGFLAAVFLLRKLALRAGQDPDHITNVALYALISGVAGARIFYVVHHFKEFRYNPWWHVFAVWQGGLEFVGGLIVAVIIVVTYLFRKKLSIKLYLDILAIGLLVGVCSGRMGCFLRGCCYGRPAGVPWAIRFPYDSPVYNSQVRPDLARTRDKPHLDLPAEYFGYMGEDGQSWFYVDEEHKFSANLKPTAQLSDQERYDVKKGPYRCLPVHPAQLYASLNAIVLCGLLLLIWRKLGRRWPGCTFGLMLALYGFSRFWLGFLRDDNPFESSWWTITDKLTVSQNLGIYIAALGLIVIIVSAKTRPFGAAAGREARTISISSTSSTKETQPKEAPEKNEPTAPS